MGTMYLALLNSSKVVGVAVVQAGPSPASGSDLWLFPVSLSGNAEQQQMGPSRFKVGADGLLWL